MAINKKIVIKIMLTTLWVTIGAGTIVLLVAAVRMKDAQRCKGVNINIIGVQNSFFVDKKDILDSIAVIEGGDPVGNPVGSFDLKSVETKLKRNVWVKKAELFFDNNNTLQVKVIEREPVARVFTTNGTTFYIDTAIKMLPLSEKFSARLPVFTDFPSDKIVLAKADSNLLRDVSAISTAIQKDSFCMAFIDQVVITPQHTFEFVPKIGNSIIIFGDASDAAGKFNKLKLFYKKVIPKTGWNYYSVINVQYKGQVVAKRKGADDKSADSLRTIQIMQQIAINAEKAANDSTQMIQPDNGNNTTDDNIIQQSMQRDDNEDAPGDLEKVLKQSAIVPTVITKPAVAPKPVVPIAAKPKPVIVSKPAATVVKPKPVVVSKPATTAPKPKPAVVPVKKPAIVKPTAATPKQTEDKPKPKVNKQPEPLTKPIPTKPLPAKKPFESKPNNDY